mmetsp:Transcript_36266/g.104177  ORF Transcript_36266/g.104177 Transcript_36266/m.104177 type:complete len:239 (+) Transcript_36266:296-1012(+)
MPLRWNVLFEPSRAQQHQADRPVLIRQHIRVLPISLFTCTFLIFEAALRHQRPGAPILAILAGAAFQQALRGLILGLDAVGGGHRPCAHGVRHARRRPVVLDGLPSGGQAPEGLDRVLQDSAQFLDFPSQRVVPLDDIHCDVLVNLGDIASDDLAKASQELLLLVPEFVAGLQTLLCHLQLVGHHVDQHLLLLQQPLLPLVLRAQTFRLEGDAHLAGARAVDVDHLGLHDLLLLGVRA